MRAGTWNGDLFVLMVGGSRVLRDPPQELLLPGLLRRGRGEPRPPRSPPRASTSGSSTSRLGGAAVVAIPLNGFHLHDSFVFIPGVRSFGRGAWSPSWSSRTASLASWFCSSTTPVGGAAFIAIPPKIPVDIFLLDGAQVFLIYLVLRVFFADFVLLFFANFVLLFFANFVLLYFVNFVLLYFANFVLIYFANFVLLYFANFVLLYFATPPCRPPSPTWSCSSSSPTPPCRPSWTSTSATPTSLATSLGGAAFARSPHVVAHVALPVCNGETAT